MKDNHIYFIEKTTVLIRKLIIGQGTSKQRLRECEYEINLSLSLPVPDDLEKLRQKIRGRLFKKNEISDGTKVTMTSFEHTNIYMKNKTASDIINDIFDLYTEIKFRNQYYK